jgi:hypothetical protein
MKITSILCVLFLTISTIGIGQNPKILASKGLGLYFRKEYKKAYDVYIELMKTGKETRRDLLNAAGAAAKIGDKKNAYRWLNKAYDKGFTNVDYLKDSDYDTLKGTKKWDNLVEKVNKKKQITEANYDKVLQKTLLDIGVDDQLYRKNNRDFAKKYGIQSVEYKDLWKKQKHLDSINLVKVTEITDKYGWIGFDQVGVEACSALFLVIHHSSDKEAQKKYLPMIRKAVKNNLASGDELALLEDRIALGEGKKQVYGTQISQDEVGKQYVQPLIDPDHVDERRAEVGLILMEDYAKYFGITWNVEEYKKWLVINEERLLKEAKLH